VISAVRGDFYHRCVQAEGFTRLVGGAGPIICYRPAPGKFETLFYAPQKLQASILSLIQAAQPPLIC